MNNILTNEQIDKLKEWDLILRNISDFVQIEKVNGIKFEVRTNEQCGHNKPHLHVLTSSASLSIAIEDGEILAQSGKISPPQIKQAQKWIKNNYNLIVDKWNEFSNGLMIEIA